MGGGDHRCEWREKYETAAAELASLKATLSKLTRHAYGTRSEKMPSPASAMGAKVDPAAALDRRRARAAARAQLETVDVAHPIAPEKRVCPSCGGTNLKPLGAGKVSFTYEYIPARVVRHRHVRECAACVCGQG